MMKNKTTITTRRIIKADKRFSIKIVGKLILPYLALIFTAQSSSAEDLIILRGNIDYPPDEMHIDGLLTGFNIELIQLVAASIPLSIEFQSFPWKRAVNMLKNGEGDAISYLSKTPAREKFALFLEGNIQTETNYHFVINSARKEEIQYNGTLKDLADYSIGIQRGYDYGKQFNQEKSLKKIKGVREASVNLLLKKASVDVDDSVRQEDLEKAEKILND